MPADQINKERDHHPYGMSVLNYIAACEVFKGRGGDNEAAQDGTRLHEIMQRALERSVSSEKVFRVEQSVMTSLREILETEAVSEEEEFYLEYCAKEVDQWLPKATGLLTEQRVYIYNPDSTVLNFGHYDLLLFLGENVAINFDWKFGWIPVPAAAANWQGKGYAVGCLQQFPKLEKIAVVFVQPKLHKTTRATYARESLYDMYREIRDVIARAQAKDQQPTPGQYCDFCIHAATCSGLLNEANRALAVYEGLPVPAGFQGLQISTAEDAARAMLVLDRLKVLLDHADDLKAKAKEFARDNGNMIIAPLPDGRLVTVELRTKNAARSAHDPGMIAEVLKDIVSPEQVLAACDPNITTLEKIFADAFVEKRNAEAQAVLARAEAAAQQLGHSGDHTGAAQVRQRAKAEAKAIRITKKRAVQILNETLLAEGLLSRPDNRVEFLKVRVEKPVKQINTSSNG